MSFSSDAKLELAQLLPADRCCALAELGAFWRVEGAPDRSGRSRWTARLSFGAAARKVYYLLKAAGFEGEALVQRTASKSQRRGYLVKAKPIAPEFADEVRRALGGSLHGASLPEKPCCRRAYLRGAFLCRGSVAEPSKSYHLEFAVDRPSVARSLATALQQFDLPARVARRKGSYVAYVKESEGIVGVLSLLGAHGALLQMENVRVVKGVKNHVNRLVNCETANMDKTVNAAVAQLDAIRAIQRHAGLDALPESLRALAELRIEHPYASLRELGELLSPRVSKSGVNYRMKRLLTIASDVVGADSAEASQQEAADAKRI